MLLRRSAALDGDDGRRRRRGQLPHSGAASGDAEDISARDLADIERGVEVAGIGVYRSLAAALGVTVDDLIVPEA